MLSFSRIAAGSVQVTVEEAGVLQGFRRDYPWYGSRSSQHTQIGNAIPPRLAAHIIAVLVGVDPTGAINRYYHPYPRAEAVS